MWQRSYGLLFGPAVGIYALRYDRPLDPEPDSPRPKRKTLAADFDPARSGPAALFLLIWRLPRYVAWFVSGVMVKASKLMLVARSLANVGQESVEGAPSRADLYAAASIAVESLHRRILAAANHGVPRSPRPGPFATPAVAMLPIPWIIHGPTVTQEVIFG